MSILYVLITSKTACYTLAMRMMMATTNRGKVAELKRILGDVEVELLSLERGAETESVETGSTFAENALLKARFYHDRSGLITIADDSGLEVGALGGAPGLYSARYGATDAERIARLLDDLRDVPVEGRTARFVCAAAIVWEGGERVFSDEVRGRITFEPRGENGFGFDPIFYFEPAGKTFAEMTRDEKSRVSHRGRAFARLAAWLKDAGLLDTSKSGAKIKLPTGSPLLPPYKR
jgi:XTP/dITP diphosphohydrolase